MPKPVLEGKYWTVTFFLNDRFDFDSFLVDVARLLATARYDNIVGFMSVNVRIVNTLHEYFGC